MCLRCAQMFSDVHRCVQMITDVFWIFSWYSIDVILMFSRCSLDLPRMFAGFFQDDHFQWKYGLWWSKGTRWSPTIWWSQLFDDPKLFDDPQPFDDPQLFDDQLEVWTLIIEKSTVIPSSPMVLFTAEQVPISGLPIVSPFRLPQINYDLHISRFTQGGGCMTWSGMTGWLADGGACDGYIVLGCVEGDALSIIHPLSPPTL